MRAQAPVIPLVLAIVLASACGGQHAAAPHPAAPALLAAVPADTPYVIASLEPVPLEVLAAYRDAIGGAMRDALEHPEGEDRDPQGDDAYHRLLGAFFAELDGKWTAAGLESLGLSATPRFTLYGLGLAPVLRLEIRDGALLFGTVERIARRARLPLPPPERRDGHRLWRVPDGKGELAVAIGADQLVLAYHPAARLDASLPLILEARRPARSMADSAALAAARARHHLGGQAVAILDTRRLVAELARMAAAAEAPPPPACAAALDRLAARAPRVVGGLAMTAAAQETAAVLELAPDLLAELRALRVELPALADALAGQPLLAAAVGVDLPRAQALGLAAAEAIARTADACGLPSGSAHELARDLARPLPPPLAQLAGAVLSIRTLELAAGPLPLPTALDGFALASSPQAPALFALLRDAVSGVLPLDFGPDGALHPIPQDRLPLSLPFDLYAGAGPRAIAVAAGAEGRRRAERALAAPGARAPIFTLDLDYRRFLELRARLDPSKDQDVLAARARLADHARMSLDVSEHGLELRALTETRPPPR